MLFLPAESNDKNEKKIFSSFEDRSKFNFKRKRTNFRPVEENQRFSFYFDSKRLPIKTNAIHKKKQNRIGLSKFNNPNLSIDSNFLSPKTEFHRSQLENIDISRIPANIERFYALALQKKENEKNDRSVNKTVEKSDDDSSTSEIEEKSINYELLETLIEALQEPDKSFSIEKEKINVKDQIESIDVVRFRSSHAALIDLGSRQIIYINKQVVWFGSSSTNEICLENFDSTRKCSAIDERHACLYYDRKRNSFELLNYSDYGTIVNGLRYGLQTNDIEDLHRQSEGKCSCLSDLFQRSSWDGAAQIERGTIFRIGCHSFLFYRYHCQ